MACSSVARGGGRLARPVRAGHGERARPGEHRRARAGAPARGRRSWPASPPRSHERARLAPRQHERERAGPAGRRQPLAARSSNRARRSARLDGARRGRAGSDRAGRAFAANSRAVAAGSSGEVPMPYTVSVGSTISAPRRAAAAASVMGSGVTAAVGHHEAVAAGEVGARPAASVRPATLADAVTTSSPCDSPISTTTSRRPAAAMPPPRRTARSHELDTADQRRRRGRPAPRRAARRPLPAARRAGCSRPGRAASERRRDRRAAGRPRSTSTSSPSARGVLAARAQRRRRIDRSRTTRASGTLVAIGERDGARPGADVDDHRRGPARRSPRGRARPGPRSPGAGRTRPDARRASSCRNPVSPGQVLGGRARRIAGRALGRRPWPPAVAGSSVRAASAGRGRSRAR